MRTKSLGGIAMSGVAVLPTLCAAAVFALVTTGGAAAGDWSGAYGGVHAGYAWGNASVLDNAADGVPPGPYPYTVSGAFGGATLGTNWQNNNFVFGVEGDLGYMNLNGAGIIPSSNPIYHQDITVKGGLYGDLTARLGFAMGGMLLYGKGGAAFFGGPASQVTTKPGYAPTSTGMFTGWTAGAGIEKQVTPTVSVKLEYQHFDFGTQQATQVATIADPPTPVGYVFKNWTTLTADSIKIGINWRFGP